MKKEKIYLADSNSNKLFMDALVSFGASMNVQINYHQVDFNGLNVDLSLTNENFYFVQTKTLSLEEIYDDFAETEDERNPDNQYFKDYLDDLMYEMKDDLNLSGLLLDTDSSKPLYLNVSQTNNKEYHIISDQVLLRVVYSVYLTGEKYNTLFDNVDLKKFAKRLYDDDGMNPQETNQTDLPTIYYTYDGKVLFSGENIDHRLLTSWMKHQFLKQIFPTKNEPFFERDGLIHFRTHGYGDIQPEYELPENITDFYRSIKDFKLSRKYNDSERFL